MADEKKTVTPLKAKNERFTDKPLGFVAALAAHAVLIFGLITVFQWNTEPVTFTAELWAPESASTETVKPNVKENVVSEEPAVTKPTQEEIQERIDREAQIRLAEEEKQKKLEEMARKKLEQERKLQEQKRALEAKKRREEAERRRQEELRKEELPRSKTPNTSVKRRATCALQHPMPALSGKPTMSRKSLLCSVRALSFRCRRGLKAENGKRSIRCTYCPMDLKQNPRHWKKARGFLPLMRPWKAPFAGAIPSRPPKPVKFFRGPFKLHLIPWIAATTDNAQ